MLTTAEENRIVRLQAQMDEGVITPAGTTELRSLLKKEEVARLREEAGTMDQDIYAARKAALKEGSPTVSGLFPYGAMAMANDENPILPAVKDVLSYPGRTVAGLVSGDFTKTSEEYASEGSHTLAGIADPSTGGMMLAAPVAEGLAAPAIAAKLAKWGAGYLPEVLTKTAASAAPQVAANFSTKQALEGEYGEGDLVGDILASISGPAAAAIAGAPSRLIARASLRKELGKDVPVEVLDEVYDKIYRQVALNPGAVGKKMSNEAAVDLEGGLLPAPKAGAEVRGPRGAFKLPREERELGKWTGELIENSMDKGPRAGGRTPAQAKAAIAKVDEFDKTLEMLRSRVENGSMTDEVYRELVAQEMRKIADIPEVMKTLKIKYTNLGRDFNNAAVKEAMAMSSALEGGRPLPPRFPEVDKAAEALRKSNIETPLARMSAGEGVAGGLYTRDLPIPTGLPGAVTAAKNAISTPRWTSFIEGGAGMAGTVAGSRFPYLPDDEEMGLPAPR